MLRPSKQQKRAEREQFIIEQALRLFETKGFLGARMSDVAKTCELSMGTIYSHYAAKEDLLMACATFLVSEEKRIFASIIQADEPPMQRIVTAFTVNWLISQHHPALVEIDHLSLMPSIWSRAELERIEKLNALHASFFDLARGVVLEMLSSEFNGFAEMDDASQQELALLLNHGMWGLCVGLNSTAQSGIARADSDSHETCSYRHFTINVIHFLKGCGWREGEPEKVFHACRKQAEASLAEHSWFACPQPSTPQSLNAQKSGGEA